MERNGWTYALLVVVLAGFLLLPPAQAEAQKIHWTRIEAVHSKKCMDVKGNSRSNGAIVQQSSCKRKKGSNQRFQVVSAGGGTYYFVNRNSGRCLDVKGASTKDGARLQQYSCKGGNNQRFKLGPGHSPGYQMVGQHSGKCLEVKGANRSKAPIVQGGCSGAPNQSWRIRGIPK
jgi:hypothetical protein